MGSPDIAPLSLSRYSFSLSTMPPKPPFSVRTGKASPPVQCQTLAPALLGNAVTGPTKRLGTVEPIGPLGEATGKRLVGSWNALRSTTTGGACTGVGRGVGSASDNLTAWISSRPEPSVNLTSRTASWGPKSLGTSQVNWPSGETFAPGGPFSRAYCTLPLFERTSMA